MTNDSATLWSRLAEQYERVVDAQCGGRARALVRERLMREPFLGRVVEFGCGTGFYTEVLAQKAETVLATDISGEMLRLARERLHGADSVAFQLEDCERTSLADHTYDTAFLGLVIHFTEPGTTAREMHRILTPSGRLIIANLNWKALEGWQRLRSLIRTVYHGVVGYRGKPPAGRNVLTEGELTTLLQQIGFRVDGAERIKDDSRASSIPIDYVTATKL